MRARGRMNEKMESEAGMKTAIKVMFKILLTLCAVVGVLALLRCLAGQQADYIEIFNDDLDEGLLNETRDSADGWKRAAQQLCGL